MSKNPISALTQITTVSQNNMTFNVYFGITDAYLNVEMENLKEIHGDAFDVYVSGEFDAQDKMVLVALASDETEFAWTRLGDESIESLIKQLTNDLIEFLEDEKEFV